MIRFLWTLWYVLLSAATGAMAGVIVLVFLALIYVVIGAIPDSKAPYVMAWFATVGAIVMTAVNFHFRLNAKEGQNR